MGREAFAGLGSLLGGQCTQNPILGTWYSLTEAARAVGAWKLMQRVRTVSLRCLIGMGAIILDNAEIGEDSIIGAATLVTENAKIPPRSLVLGTPGKVVRQLKDEEVARILQSAKNYMEYTQNYLKEGAKGE